MVLIFFDFRSCLPRVAEASLRWGFRAEHQPRADKAAGRRTHHALAQAHDLLLQANWSGATLEINSSCVTGLHKGFGQCLIRLDLEANQKACFDYRGSPAPNERLALHFRVEAF